jgi:hypothetical protein
MNVQQIFASVVEARFDFDCPAVQAAIDRLVSAENFRGRMGLVETLNSGLYDALAFNSSLLSAWKPSDVFLVTQKTVDEWLSLREQMKNAALINGR